MADKIVWKKELDSEGKRKLHCGYANDLEFHIYEPGLNSCRFLVFDKSDELVFTSACYTTTDQQLPHRVRQNTKHAAQRWLNKKNRELSKIGG